MHQTAGSATGLGGSLGQREGHGRDKAGSTPPVVPGAAPALAKAGVGGYWKLQVILTVLFSKPSKRSRGFASAGMFLSYII